MFPALRYLSVFPSQSQSFDTWYMGYKDHLDLNEFIFNSQNDLQVVLNLTARGSQETLQTVTSSCSPNELGKGVAAYAALIGAFQGDMTLKVDNYGSRFPFVDTNVYSVGHGYQAVLSYGKSILNQLKSIFRKQSH